MTHKEKILVYNNTMFSVSQTFIYHQAACLTDKYDVHLIASNFVNPHDYDLNDFKTMKINEPENLIDFFICEVIKLYFNSRINLNLKSYKKLRNLFGDKHVKAMHVHFGSRAMEILGFAKKFNIPLVVTFHGYDASQLLNNKQYAGKLPELFEYASAIIVVSSHMIDTLKLESWIEKVHLIPCSVDPDEFLQKNMKPESDVVKIVHSGRLVEKKGVPDLIRVFAELANIHKNIELHIIGDGEELEVSKKLVAEYGISGKVKFYGAVSHNKVKSLLNEADIFVLNSRTDENGDMEGTPVTILEAMCMGRAVVSTRHAGIPSVIEHGKNGLLVNEYSNEELRIHIEKLIKNPELRQSLGIEAEKTVRESYTKNIMNQKLKQIFESI